MKNTVEHKNNKHFESEHSANGKERTEEQDGTKDTLTGHKDRTGHTDRTQDTHMTYAHSEAHRHTDTDTFTHTHTTHHTHFQLPKSVLFLSRHDKLQITHALLDAPFFFVSSLNFLVRCPLPMVTCLTSDPTALWLKT